jgi:hypothetical protein
VRRSTSRTTTELTIDIIADDRVFEATVIDLHAATTAAAPFPHALAAECLPADVAAALLNWLEADAPWRLVEADFYEQYEFSLSDVCGPPAAALTEPSALAGLRTEMTRLFGRRFETRVSVVAHKLLPGQRIAIHHDYLTGEETHRLVVQLNRGLTDADGGFLMLFNSGDPKDVHQILRPVHRSGLAFEISAHSFHAVSRQHANVRYTLVFSFYAEPN